MDMTGVEREDGAVASRKKMVRPRQWRDANRDARGGGGGVEESAVSRRRRRTMLVRSLDNVRPPDSRTPSRRAATAVSQASELDNGRTQSPLPPSPALLPPGTCPCAARGLARPPLHAYPPLLAAHCSTERTMRAHLDSLKNRLRAKDDELGRKGLEMEGLARSLREAKMENRRIQAELEKGSEAKAEIDRLSAELVKEQEQNAMLTAYYDSAEPQMEALQ
uniref:Uncharacterized protein n=1 Tax=Oryza punctata TaxID=4537 RepID=A0A0E0MHD2_ORYPU